MRARDRDAEFRQFADRERPRLVGTAYLVFADAESAERAVEAVLADLYARWPTVGDAKTFAYAHLLGPDSSNAKVPWRREERVQLRDVLPSAGSRATGIIADLARLAPDERRVIVLEQYAQLPTPQIAAVLSGCGTCDDTLDSAGVHLLAQRALSALIRLAPQRQNDAVLTAELGAAVPYAGSVERSSTEADRAHGRMLIRRRQLRFGAVVAVILIVAALIITPVVKSSGSRTEAQAPVTQPSTSASPEANSQSARCNVEMASCRVQLARDWRAKVSSIVSGYLDPTGGYFSGYSYSYTPAYGSYTPTYRDGAFWQGKSGALALDMFRAQGGATELFIQVATSRRDAIPCGQMTHQQCVLQEFMDGNSYLLTPTTFEDEGIEVQYRPEDNAVITVVARDVSKGPRLKIGRGEIIRLVRDPRLRLPPG